LSLAWKPPLTFKNLIAPVVLYIFYWAKNIMMVSAGSTPGIGPIDQSKVTALATYFSNTLSPDQSVRVAAEKQLAHIASSLPNFSTDLLSFLLHGDYDLALKQAAAVYLKNHVEEGWSKEAISSEEKQVFKEMIVPAMIRCQNQVPVHKQLRECVHRMVREEFPGKWPSLVDQIQQCLTDGSSTISGLIVLYEVIAWKGYDNDPVTEEIHARFSPLLLHIAQSALKLASEEGYSIIRWVLKVFRAAVLFSFSYPLLHHFDPWNHLFCEIISLPTPAMYLPSGEDDKGEDLEDTGFWKMKEWAFICQNKVFSRYGNEKKSCSSTAAIEFQKRYLHTYAASVFTVNMRLIESIISKTAFTPECIFIELCEYLQTAVKCNELWKKSGLKSHMQQIIQLFLFPKVCFSQEDYEEWRDDPVEFIRSNLDPYEEYETASTSALNLISDTVRARTKTVFEGLLVFINTTLHDSQHPERQEGALRMLGSLVSQIKKNEHLSSQVNHLVSQLIFPLLSGNQVIPYLKMRAAWTLEQFATDFNFDDQIALQAFHVLFNNLSNKNDLPVRVQSVLAISSLMDVDAVQKAIEGQSALKLTELVLDLANQVELESLGSLIEKLVTMYSEDLAPFSSQLAQQLAGTFVRMINTVHSTDNEGNLDFETTDKMMTAIGIIRALVALVESMSANKTIMLSLSLVIGPLVSEIFSRRVVDVYDETFELLLQLTFHLKSIPDHLWDLFDLMFSVFEISGIEIISDFTSVLDNYISYGSAKISSTPAYLQKIVLLCQKVLSREDSSCWDEFNSICIVLESLFLNNQHILSLDDIKVMISLLEKRLTVEIKDGSKASIIHLLEVFLSILISHQQSILPHLPSLFWEQLVLRQKNFTRVHDKRLIITALSSVLPFLNDSKVLEVYVEAVMTLSDAMKKRQKLIDESGSDDSDLDDDYYYTNDSDYDSIDSGADEGQEGITSRSSSKMEQDAGSDSSSYNWSDSEFDDFDDGSDDEILEENLGTETPLDHIDVSSLIKASVKGVDHSVINGMSEEKKEFFKTLLY
jgi:importin-7